MFCFIHESSVPLSKLLYTVFFPWVSSVGSYLTTVHHITHWYDVP